jgi:hypothetical protein
VKNYSERANVRSVVDSHAGKLSKSLKVGSAQSNRITPLVVFDIDDTLLREGKSKPVAIQPIIKLFHDLRKAGAYIALITARLEEPATRRGTIESLGECGVFGWDELHLAPASARRNMAEVSKWKHSTRANIAKRKQQPVVLSTGDQWGDLLPLSADSDIDDMNEAFGLNEPYQLVRPHDGFTLWGLKLLSYDHED